MKLEMSALRDLTCAPGRKDQIVFFDGEAPGFGMRVTVAGIKTFILQYRPKGGGQVRRLTLGRFGEAGGITPTEARRLAERNRADIAAGADPFGARKARAAAEAEAAAQRRQAEQVAALTLDKLIDAWELRQLSHRSTAYRAEAPRALRVALAGLLSLPAATVEAAAVQRALDAIPRAAAPSQGGKGVAPTRAAPSPAIVGATMARRVKSYGHALFSWAVAKRMVAANPFAGASVDGRDVARDRVLSDAELAEIWHAAGALGWPWGPYFRFLLLTLQREAETAGLRWEELSDNFATWHLPAARTKNRRAHLVHLAEPARAVLRGIQAEAAAPAESGADLTAHAGRRAPRADAPFVFSTTARTPLSGFSHAKARLDAAIVKARALAAAETGKSPAPLVPWRLHDFRRTGVTVLAGLGVRWEVADKLLNHAHGAIRGVAAVYQRHEFLPERRAALDAWAAHLVAVARGQHAGATECVAGRSRVSVQQTPFAGGA